MIIYRKYWHEVEKKNWPQPDQYFVCLDNQDRLGKSGWLVCQMRGEHNQYDLTQRGLFWDLDDAVIFASLLEDG